MSSRVGAQRTPNHQKSAVRSVVRVLRQLLAMNAIAALLYGCAQHHVSDVPVVDAAVSDAGLPDANVTPDVGPMDAGPAPVDLEYDWGLGPLDSDTSECAALVADVYLESSLRPETVTLAPGAAHYCWDIGVVVDAALAPLVERVASAHCRTSSLWVGTFCMLPASRPVSDDHYALYCDVNALFPSARWRCQIYGE